MSATKTARRSPYLTKLGRELRDARIRFVSELAEEGRTTSDCVILYAQKHADGQRGHYWECELCESHGHENTHTRIDSELTVDAAADDVSVASQIADWSATITNCWEEEWTDRDAA